VVGIKKSVFKGFQVQTETQVMMATEEETSNTIREQFLKLCGNEI
jgi:hypothetical protein